jgi:hypothetical protein
MSVPQQDKLKKAIETAPAEYQAYIAAAREAARMLRSLYSPQSTKFAMTPIQDDQLMPVFP